MYDLIGLVYAAAVALGGLYGLIQFGKQAINYSSFEITLRVRY